jgi:hypothetical protein
VLALGALHSTGSLNLTWSGPELEAARSAHRPHPGQSQGSAGTAARSRERTGGRCRGRGRLSRRTCRRACVRCSRSRTPPRGACSGDGDGARDRAPGRSAGCRCWRLRRSTRKLRVHRASRPRFPWCMHEAAWAAARFAGAVAGGVPQQVRRDVDGRKQQLRLDIPATNPPSVPREYRLRPLSIDGAGVGCPGCALRAA